MTDYVSLPHNKKLNLLRAHSLGCDWPNLDQEHWCLHCRKKFNGHSVRVWKSRITGFGWSAAHPAATAPRLIGHLIPGGIRDTERPKNT